MVKVAVDSDPVSATAGGTPGGTGTATTPAAGATPGGVAERNSPRPPKRSVPAGPSDPTRAEDVPASGPGTFTVAQGEGEAVGAGTPLRYQVAVEDGLALSVADAAAQVDGVLAHPRGWTADGGAGFQRVAPGSDHDFVVQIATPGTVDRICGAYGLDTGGEVNCRVDDKVVVNLRRWVLATPVYEDDVAGYRALIINHEVGHFLGHGHQGCPGQGAPAPVMMQQIKGMHGCLPNVWPFDADGRPVTGPAVP